MGIFTWTDARKKCVRGKNGEFKDSDICMYGHFCKIVCPDDSVISTDYYNGYGTFGGTDVYEVVVDWNREDLKAIAERKKTDFFGEQLWEIAIKYADGASEDEVTEYVEEKAAEGKLPEYLISDWKRNLGIMIACDDEDNASLRYPIKITRTVEKVRYEDLYPSWNTQ